MCVCLCFIIILMDLGNLFVQTSPVHQLCKSLTQPNSRNVCQGELWTTENTRWETWNGNHYMGNFVLVTSGFLFMVHSKFGYITSWVEVGSLSPYLHWFSTVVQDFFHQQYDLSSFVMFCWGLHGCYHSFQVFAWWKFVIWWSWQLRSMENSCVTSENPSTTNVNVKVSGHSIQWNVPHKCITTYFLFMVSQWWLEAPC